MILPGICRACANGGALCSRAKKRPKHVPPLGAVSSRELPQPACWCYGRREKIVVSVAVAEVVLFLVFKTVTEDDGNRPVKIRYVMTKVTIPRTDGGTSGVRPW